MKATPAALDTVTDLEGLEAWLSQWSNRERSGDYSDWKLEPMQGVLAGLRLREPLRPITVAGTKGKGSTVAFLERIFLAHGQECIAFSSPHISSVCERWRRNGELIRVNELALHCTRIDQALAAAGHQATYFERCFLLACCLAEANPQAQFICEVGLGGRLDCANILSASCVCLTSLGLDHTHILGPTLDHIAGEKLAVCRPHAPLFIGAQSNDAEAAIKAHIPDVAAIHWTQPSPDSLSLGLIGEHQRDNAGLALAAAAFILADAFSPSLARHGLSQATLPARCQRLQLAGRELMVDGAHTSESLAATLHTAEAVWGTDYQVLFSCAGDKDLSRLCQLLGPQRRVLRCAYAWERCVQPDDPRWPDFTYHWPWFDSVAKALQSIDNDPRPLLVTGSFYLAGEVLNLGQQQR